MATSQKRRYHCFKTDLAVILRITGLSPLKILPLLLFLFSALSGYAQTYYLNQAGDDTNDGLSKETAWRSLARVGEMNLLPGDTLLLEGGTLFPGNLVFDNNDGNDPDQPVVIGSYGNEAAVIDAADTNGIIFQNTQGFELSGLKIKGAGMNQNTGSGVVLLNENTGNFKLSSFKLSDIEITGFGVAGIVIYALSDTSGFKDVYIENARVYNCLDAGIGAIGSYDQNKTGYAHQNIFVRNSLVYNIPGYDKEIHSGNGIVLSDVENSVIENCVVHDCGMGNTQCGGPVGAWYFDAKDVLIQYNEIYNISSGSGCDGAGFDLDGGVVNGIMQYNYSHNNDGAGFLVGQFVDSRPMKNITVRYNLSVNDAQTNGGGIYLFNGNPDYPVIDAFIYNNTVYLEKNKTNNEQAVVKMLDWLPVGENIIFNNNLLFAANDALMVSVPENYKAGFFANLYYSTQEFRIDYNGRIYNDLNSFRESGNEINAQQQLGIQADPLLKNPGEEPIAGGAAQFGNLTGYQFTATSPAFNAGINLDTDTGGQDFFKQDYIFDGTQDIGFYEYHDTIPPVIKLIGDNPMTLEAGSEFTDPGAETDDGSPVTADISELGDLPGTYQVIYNASDSYGNQAEPVTRTVIIVDTTPPVITLLGDNPFIMEEGTSFNDPGAITDDGSEVNINTSGLQTEQTGVYEIIYTAVDDYGNEAEPEIRLVEVIPESIKLSCTPYTVDLSDNQKVLVNVGEVIGRDTDLSIATSITPENIEFSCDQIGENQVTIHIEDSFGRAYECEMTFRVFETQDPRVEVDSESTMRKEIILLEKEHYVLPDLTSMIDYADNCDPAPVLIQIPAPGSKLEEGDHEIRFQVTDKSGNNAFAGFTLNIRDIDSDEGTLRIYPNPATQTIRFSRPFVKAVIFNTYGERVLSAYHHMIDISSLQNGLYFVQFITEDGEYVKRLIKN
ncbi:immunoglobulin-like domain-containing protein [Robertkochia aurantiaca]|uniref:immunoglobulin-like domain-containing protein n=1 Tax=Robertkochia aurantiaca TaxID=2873700 RepID=UPI001CCE3D66|nr:immunoglobulin-like domain-containing protein [Robertkochia sp. 3YJGBD-33]